MSKNRMRVWPMYSLLAVFLMTAATFGVYGYLYSGDVAEEDKQVAAVVNAKKKVFTKDDPWQLIYPGTQKMKIKDLVVDVSVAETWPDRIKGLSDTPYLPDNLVKLFIFDTPAFHSIWMKDMQYPIDILWVNANNKIIYIEENATPESYPNIFVPKDPALYVIETVAGFVETNQINIGDTVILPL
jgi:uncharacterized membrane protein (UPF0127 family)